jgi:hypothetical protein
MQQAAYKHATPILIGATAAELSAMPSGKL